LAGFSSDAKGLQAGGARASRSARPAEGPATPEVRAQFLVPERILYAQWPKDDGCVYHSMK
jgi:hypothetical protein